ncbi:putative Zn(2)-C6 fungal-type domain-containing protein [Seiridium unicorne]|uniref:Zn(2)-C6 fungal-type domain-containing protein n=1 Tax=Seiridium unicorne TaxID=138068 RepID=A0ABR2VGS7_9PEZI
MEDGSQGRRASDTGPEPTSATSEKHPAPSSNAGPSDAANKRKRGLGVVTPNACTECRKKRAKCDGQRPCGRCKAQSVECVYEIPVRQSKENLRSEIDQLRKQQRQSDTVISALVKPELWEEVLTRIRNGQSVENISEWLGGTLPSGGGPIPTFPPRSGPMASRGPTLPPLSVSAGMSSGNHTTVPGGYNPMTMSAQQTQKHDYDQKSPWAFSSRSQTQSTRSNSHPDVMQWTADLPPQNRVGSWVQDQASTDGSRYQGADQVLAPLDAPDMKSPRTTWTGITADTALVQHLLALYFCWEYPTFASLSKEHFLKDFLDGRPRYCSPILVNALLALGCRFSTQPHTRANPDDPATSGDHFFRETLRLLGKETNHHNLTTIQALGIMSIREASCGRDSESWYYAGQSVRLAIEMGLHRLSGEGDPDEMAVQAATFWGAFALDHAWSLATGSLPQCSCFPHLPPKPAIIDDIEASLWVPYTDNGSDQLGAPLQRSCEQPSNVRSVYTCFCELSELVHNSLYVLHSPGKPVTSRDLLDTYTQYLNWYDRIPEVLRLGTNFTPAVLFAHMYYHFAILLLFRPLIKLRIIGSSVTPRDVCAQAADAIQGLSRSYSQLYTLRRTPSFVPYFVLTSSIMHLAVGVPTSATQDNTPGSGPTESTSRTEGGILDQADLRPSSNTTGPASPTPSGASTAKLSPRVVDAINQGISDLTEMAPCHNFAEQALHILRYLAKKWNIEVHIPPPAKALNAKDADQLVRPQTSSLNFFTPSVADGDFMCSWGPGSQGIPDPSGAEAATTPPPPSDANSPREEGIGRPSAGVPNPRMETEFGAGPMAHTAKSIENPLFWPFPMQGRPMLPSGHMLEEAGFALL